jgi:RIO kinase 1
LSIHFYDDQYDEYEDQYNTLHTDRRARRQRKPKTNHTPKKSYKAIIDDIADAGGLEIGFVTTYQPGRFEEGWLLEALKPLYEQALITDVLAAVKGGKEASVYRCEAHPATDAHLIAAKVYRPRMFRNLRNDAMYREGREILTERGKGVKATEHRILRAIGKKTDFGEQVAHTSWLMHEYSTLQRLYAAGAAVPKPYGTSSNAIAMAYIGDETSAAPPLIDITLESDEAPALFREVIRNIELMLKHGIIHGDLSAYNILYWEGEITLIDFPQVTSSIANGRAAPILERDIVRVCEYFAEQGVTSSGDLPCDPTIIMAKLWRRYLAKDKKQTLADVSRFETESE